MVYDSHSSEHIHHSANLNGAPTRFLCVYRNADRTCLNAFCSTCLCIPFTTKVELRAGSDDDKVDVSVGSPRYIREACSLDATNGDDVDPVIRWLLSAAEDVAEQADDGNHGAPGAILVSSLCEKLVWHDRLTFDIMMRGRPGLVLTASATHAMTKNS